MALVEQTLFDGRRVKIRGITKPIHTFVFSVSTFGESNSLCFYGRRMNPDVTHQGISDVPSCAQPPPNRPSSHDDAFFNLDSLFLDMPFEKDLPTDDELKETLKCLDSQPLDLFPPTEHYSDVQLEKFVEQQNSPSTYENGSERFWIEHSTQNLSDQSTWPHCGEKNVKMESNYVPCLFDPALVGAQGFVPRHLSRSSVLSSSKFRYDGSHKVLKANSNSLKKSFRGVSRHRLTQRWEASLWLNGKQLYLGGFNVQEDAARAYDLAALACKGAKASTNFRAAEYERQLRELHDHSEEEVVAYIRRRSTAFSRGRSKYRGVSGQSGRWEARIGSFKGRKNVRVLSRPSLGLTLFLRFLFSHIEDAGVLWCL